MELNIEHLTKQYGHHVALQDISLSCGNEMVDSWGQMVQEKLP